MQVLSSLVLSPCLKFKQLLLSIFHMVQWSLKMTCLKGPRKFATNDLFRFKTVIYKLPFFRLDCQPLSINHMAISITWMKMFKSLLIYSGIPCVNTVFIHVYCDTGSQVQMRFKPLMQGSVFSQKNILNLIVVTTIHINVLQFYSI